MGVNLSGRSFLKLLDLTTEEIEYLLKLSKNFKDMKRAGVPHRYLEGKNIVLLFQKTSTRTRCAFEVGGIDLGMGVTYLDPGSSQMGKKESIEDTARAENVREIKTSIISYMKESGDQTLEGFLADVALYTDLDNYDKDADSVVMMTMHSAKGLEFPTVFIRGSTRSLLSSRSI